MKQFAIVPTNRVTALALGVLACCASATPARADELFAGGYVHEVDTPLTLKVAESGADIVVGYRFAPVERLSAIGKPAPFVIASVNTAGDTSFAGAGLSWTIGKGQFYLRPAVGLVVHDGDTHRIDPVAGRDYGLGTRWLFEADLGIGYRASERLSIEASWMHVSNGRLIDKYQNPGIDMMGLRLNLALD